mgnify:CR=1 FL=1
MPLWKIVPAASLDDPRWLDRRPWREVLVRAQTASMARLTASGLDRPPEADIGVGNETDGFASAFDDEKLYWVTEVDASASGPAEIVSATPLGSG